MWLQLSNINCGLKCTELSRVFYCLRSKLFICKKKNLLLFFQKWHIVTLNHWQSPGQYESQISAGVGSHFLSFLGLQCWAEDPLLESSQGSGSERQKGVICVDYFPAVFSSAVNDVMIQVNLALTWKVKLKGGPITPGSSSDNSDLISYRVGFESLLR